MGERRQKPNWECIYCNYKGVLEELRVLGYTEETKKCEAIFCPRCDCGQEVNR